MSWQEVDVRSQRIRFVVEAVQGRWSMTELCRRYGISRETGHKWVRRYRQVGNLAELDALSRRPHESPSKTSEEIEQRVVDLRTAYGWAGKKLSRMLGEEGIKVAPATVDRIIRRRGLTHERKAHYPATQRFERPHPNDLWQMDFKGHYRVQEGVCHPLSLIDDHSRFALGLTPLASQHGALVRQSLISSFEEYGVPEAILTDRGNPWFGTTNGKGLTQLSVFLICQGIKIIYCGVGHPQTQGKVERFHRSLDERLRQWKVPPRFAAYRAAFDRFRQEYNEKRPHEALGLDRPADHYQPSRRAYDPDPPPWEYPPGSEVRRLNSGGCLEIDGFKLFVSHALAGHDVRCERYDQRMLVSFRHMLIRDIDLDTGSSLAVVKPRSKVSGMS
jgi:transposase InsO family protein